jgi:archaellum component FlaF (FlaF/FlaG flagellin family)
MELIMNDYEKEIKEIFDDALKEIDPELLKTIEIISQINESNSNEIQVKTYSNGTFMQEMNYAE